MISSPSNLSDYVSNVVERIATDVKDINYSLTQKANKEDSVYFVDGTGTTAGVWLGTHTGITEYYKGLTIAYKVGIAGVSGGSTLNINNLGAVAVIRNNGSAITTHYGVGSILMLTYDIGADTGTAYWKMADYDSDTKTRSSNLTGKKMYVIGAQTQSTSGQTTYSNSGVYIGTDNLLYSGSKKVATVDDINGKADADHDHRFYGAIVPIGTMITASESDPKDINSVEYLKVGNYYCTQNAQAEFIANLPENKQAFMMQVWSPLSATVDDETGTTWRYRLRKFYQYQGREYIQYCYVGGTANQWVYGPWKKVIYSDNTATTSADGLMSADDKSKLDGIASGANKYTHPSHTAKSSGLYKITVDSSGHVSAATAVTKADITGLGIPAQDTTYTLSSFGVNASSTELNYVKGVTSAIQTQLNNKASTSSVTTALSDAKSYTDTKVAALVNSAPTTLDTLGELATALQNNVGVTDALNTAIGNKANASEVVKLSGNQTIAGTKTFSSTISGSINGNAATATKATQDGSGNVITSTYATKTELTNGLSGKSDTGHTHSTYLPLAGGDMTGSISFGTTKGDGIKWGTINSLNPYMGYCTNSGDGTFVVGSLLGTTYQTGLAIGGSSGNLLWKGAKVVTSDNVSEYANKYSLPNATSSVLGGVKIGSNITVSSGTISLTKDNVVAALGYTPPTTSTTVSTMTGATSSAAGTSGLVPAPAAGKNTSFLRGDGTWVVPTDTKYTHPSYTAKSSGLYKITVDSTGHVSAATAVAKADITGLGIPSQDTTYGAATTSAAGLMSAADKTKLDGIATGANNYTYTLPNATSSVLGGVKVGTNISVSSGTISVANGSTSAKGVLQLTNSTSSTSTTTAATPAAVKSAYDLANGKQSPATTLSGYGITDAYTKTQTNSNFISWDRSGFDVDKLYDGGLFMVSSGSNVPTGMSDKYGVCLSLPYRQLTGNTKTDFGAQIFIPNGDEANKPNSMFYRTSLGDTWNAWQEVATTSYVSSNYLGKTATAAKATADASGNTITSTYLTKTDASNTYLGKTAKAASATSADSATKATQDGSGNTITSTYAKLSGATFTGAISGTSATFSGALKGATVQATSDERLKENLEKVSYDLSSLQPYKYKLKADNKTHVGLIAQQVKDVIPEAVSTDEDGYYALDYNAIVAALVGKVNELEAKINELTSQK